MTWKARHSIATATVLAVSAFYFYFLHRTTDVTNSGDWHVAFSYQPFHCRVCLGRVEKLTYRGKPIGIPQWRWQNAMETPRVSVQTPVGTYCAFQNSRNWGLQHLPIEVTDVSEEISRDELTQGWYDATGGRSRQYSGGPFIRKARTPPEWCMMATDDVARWIAPENLGKVSW